MDRENGFSQALSACDRLAPASKMKALSWNSCLWNQSTDHYCVLFFLFIGFFSPSFFFFLAVYPSFPYPENIFFHRFWQCWLQSVALFWASCEIKMFFNMHSFSYSLLNPQCFNRNKNFMYQSIWSINISDQQIFDKPTHTSTYKQIYAHAYI